MDNFHEKFDDLLSKLRNLNMDAYVFLDSNINLLNTDTNHHYNTYLTNITNSGFLLTNFRVTRIQNSATSLVDHPNEL